MHLEEAPTARVNHPIAGRSEMAARIRATTGHEPPWVQLRTGLETLLATVNLMLYSPFPTILVVGAGDGVSLQ